MIDHKVWLDSKGEITENKDKAVGRKMKYLLTHPKLVFFVDEVGDNTLQKDDGNVGGQKILVENNQQALICSSYSDSHFMVLGFKNAWSEAVCCIIILMTQMV